MNISDEDIRRFQDEVWKYYDAHGRDGLPWRQPDVNGTFDPYKIMVSELMLQQTQVSRVIPKYLAFLKQFPDASSLAAAPLGEVLTAWQGLGYNRRAKFLWQAAQMVDAELGGVFPGEQKALTALPGVGMNTAGAIVAYAYDRPVSFVETNVRTVFIHHFYDGAETLSVFDKEVLELVQRSLPAVAADGRTTAGTREWYWALMDYGTHIKQQHGNKSRASKAYAKQSPFEGSRRKVRGAVIRLLSQRPATYEQLAEHETDARLESVLSDLVREGMVVSEISQDSQDDAAVYRLG